jgi:hypothetical protein
VEKESTTSWARLTTPADAEKRPVGDVGLAADLLVPERLILEIHLNAEPGSAGMEGLTMGLHLIDGRYEVEDLSAMGPLDGYLDLEKVRRFNYRPMLALNLSQFLSGQFRYLKPKITDARARVAYRYLLAKLTGENPTKAVAEDLGISVDAAAQRVRRARQQGLLPPVTPTRKVR